MFIFRIGARPVGLWSFFCLEITDDSRDGDDREDRIHNVDAPRKEENYRYQEIVRQP